MPKVEKPLHLEAFKLYAEMGGMSQEFLSHFVARFDKSVRTAQRWEKNLDWKRRAAEPINEAIEELQEEGKLRTEELVEGLLDLTRVRMDGIAIKHSQLDAIFATAFERIPTPENPEPDNPIQIENLSQLNELILAGSRLIREEQGYMRIVLALVGEPEQALEEKMLVELVGLDEDVFSDAEQSNQNASTEDSEASQEADL